MIPSLEVPDSCTLFRAPEPHAMRFISAGRTFDQLALLGMLVFALLYCGLLFYLLIFLSKRPIVVADVWEVADDHYTIKIRVKNKIV
jgi:hypothetical protein